MNRFVDGCAGLGVGEGMLTGFTGFCEKRKISRKAAREAGRTYCLGRDATN